MPDIIQLLPDSIANQIAAGEVVQRPASVVKELMENAIDAGAKSIKLIVKEAGKVFIQVIDDGCGMSETDARMSLERHATSKIRSADDLFTLRTMGFRGEALASIAAVSQMEMKTRRPADELGTTVVVEASEVKRQEPVVTDVGTNICVKNLFFNVPARRNFLKNNAVEMRHVSDEFIRLALAHPSLSFSLIQGDELVFELPPSKLSQRIVNIYGKHYQQQLTPVQEETALLKITGYVGHPGNARRSKSEQFLYVNQRFIRSGSLGFAISNAYEGMLAPNTYPFYVLFLEINPAHIDVNVHPTKTEIKFADERAVFAVVSAAVRQALGTHHLTPVIDFTADVNLVQKLDTDKMSKEQYFDERLGTLSRSNLQHWDKLFDGDAHSSKLFPANESPVPPSVTATRTIESAINHQQGPTPHEHQPMFQLHQKYLVRGVKSGLMIIDQEAAHERVLYEQYLLSFKGTPGASQQCLFPQAINFTPADFTLIMEMEPEIKALGFRFEVFGKNAILVNGVPAGVLGNEKDVFEGLVEQFKENQATLQLPLKENLALALARRSGIKAGQKLLAEEIEAVVAGLFACTNPNFAPSGRPTFFMLDTSKIENYFK